jgi:CheY-like chemotaxis protein
MPRMNGRELADRIRKLRPGIKILFVSGYADEAILAHEALDANSSFFPKPFTPNGLAAKVRELLGAGREG